MTRASAAGALDAILFSSLVAAGVAAALTGVAGAALFGPGGTTASAQLAGTGLAFFGTLAVYNFDRLRDLERDRGGWPDRSAFVASHRGRLTALCAVAVLGGGLLALRLPPRTWLLCSFVLVTGLLHRRLKAFPGFKVAYVTLAWVAITLGIPVFSQGAEAWEPQAIAWTAAVFGAAIGANLVATSLGDRPSRVLPPFPLRWAMGLAALGIALALAAPDRVVGLAWIPLAELVALAAYRRSERYALACVDGALLVGAAAALASIAAFAGRGGPASG